MKRPQLAQVLILPARLNRARPPPPSLPKRRPSQESCGSLSSASGSGSVWFMRMHSLKQTRSARGGEEVLPIAGSRAASAEDAIAVWVARLGCKVPQRQAAHQCSACTLMYADPSVVARPQSSTPGAGFVWKAAATSSVFRTTFFRTARRRISSSYADACVLENARNCASRDMTCTR